MEGGVDGGELLFGHVFRIFERMFADGADDGEGGVEDDRGLLRRVDILVGIGDGDGTRAASEASAHGKDGERNGDNKA